MDSPRDQTRVLYTSTEWLRIPRRAHHRRPFLVQAHPNRHREGKEVAAFSEEIKDGCWEHLSECGGVHPDVLHNSMVWELQQEGPVSLLVNTFKHHKTKEQLLHKSCLRIQMLTHTPTHTLSLSTIRFTRFNFPCNNHIMKNFGVFYLYSVSFKIFIPIFF